MYENRPKSLTIQQLWVRNFFIKNQHRKRAKNKQQKKIFINDEKNQNIRKIRKLSSMIKKYTSFENKRIQIFDKFIVFRSFFSVSASFFFTFRLFVQDFNQNAEFYLQMKRKIWKCLKICMRESSKNISTCKLFVQTKSSFEIKLLGEWKRMTLISNLRHFAHKSKNGVVERLKDKSMKKNDRCCCIFA